jgi:hypothetical protein
LKLTAVVFSFLTFVALYFFVRRQFNSTVAFYVALLYVCSPPGITRFSLWAVGHYPQSQLLLVLIFILVFWICFGKYRGRRYFVNISLFGLLSGFCVFFHPISIVFIVYSFIVFLLFHRRFFKISTLLLYGITAFIGSGMTSLWYYLNLSENVLFPGKVTFFSFDNLVNAGNRVYMLFGTFLAQIWYYDDIAVSYAGILNYGFYFLLIIAFIYLLWGSRSAGVVFERVNFIERNKVIVLLLCPLVSIPLFCFTNFIQPFNPATVRFITPFYPLVCCLIVLFLFLWGTGHGLRLRICQGVFFLLVGINAIGVFKLCSMYGGDFRGVDASWGWRIGQQLAQESLAGNVDKPAEKIMSCRRGDYRKQIMFGYSDYIAAIYWKKGRQDFIAALKGIDKKFYPEIYRALGRLAYYKTGYNTKQCVMLFNGLPEAFQKDCYEGLGSIIGYKLVIGGPSDSCEKVGEFTKVMERVPVRYRRDCYRGLGSAVLWEYTPRVHIRTGENREFFAMVQRCVPGEYRAVVEEGRGQGFYAVPEW